MNLKETENELIKCADFITKTLPGLGFGLIVFEFHKASEVGNYISNATRDDMIDALREAANRLEKNEIIPKSEGGIH